MLLLPAALSAHGSQSSASSNTGFTAALNDYRAGRGLFPVVPDAELTAAAQAYAQDMASHGHFSHRGRDGSNAGTRARRAGCSWRSAAENIAWGQTSESQVLQGWADSASHRRNMLGTSYARYGLGRVGTYWVLLFADQC
jgi:uncharacterized protein YkwD